MPESQEQLLINRIIQEADVICEVNEKQWHCVSNFEEKRMFFFKKVIFPIMDLQDYERIIQQRVRFMSREKQISNSYDLDCVLQYGDMITSYPYICLSHPSILCFLEQIFEESLSENEKYLLICSIIESLKEFHENFGCIRTLRTSTIVVLSRQSEGFKVAFSEIRNSVKLKKEKETEELCKQMNHFTAPEVIQKQKHSFSADIWSLGAIIYEIVTEKPFPMGINQLNDSSELQQKLDFDNSVPNWMKNLILRALSFDPLERYKINDIFQLFHKALMCSAYRQKAI